MRACTLRSIHPLWNANASAQYEGGVCQFTPFCAKIGHHSNVSWAIAIGRSDWSCPPIHVKESKGQLSKDRMHYVYGAAACIGPNRKWKWWPEPEILRGLPISGPGPRPEVKILGVPTSGCRYPLILIPDYCGTVFTAISRSYISTSGHFWFLSPATS